MEMTAENGVDKRLLTGTGNLDGVSHPHYAL
jgi:hypothetical protein